MRQMRHRAFALVLLLLTAATAHGQPPDVKAAAEPALRQLDAFRRNDYDAAYTFASTEIHRLFDRDAFERMVRTGYPEIANSVRAHVASTRVQPNGTIYLVIKVRGANGQQIEALYEMVRELGTYKINGVVARPDPGEEA